MWNKCERVYKLNDVVHCVVCAHLLYVRLPLLFLPKCHCAHVQPRTFIRKQCRAVALLPGCGDATQSQRLTSPSHIRANFAPPQTKPQPDDHHPVPYNRTRARTHMFALFSHVHGLVCDYFFLCVATNGAAQYNNRRVLAAHRLIQQFISFTLILPFCMLYNFSRYYKCAWAV